MDHNLNFYKQILDHSPTPVAVVDKTGKFIYINRTMHLPERDVLAGNMFDFVTDEYIELAKENLHTVFEQEVTHTFDLKGYKRDQIRWFRVRINPLKDESGELYAVFSFEDINDARTKEIQLENKQAQISAIINNTDDVIFSIDKDLRVIEFNQSTEKRVLEGLGRKVQKGDHIFSLLHKPNMEMFNSIFEKILNGERIIHTDQLQTTAGNIFFETSYNPIRKGEEITGISIFSRDITSIREDEVKIRTTLKEKETLLSEIHHRVKNNLAAISSIIQLHAFNTSNTEILDLLNSAQNRIRTTALVHEMLYQNESLSHIAFHEYLRRLCENIKDSYYDPAKNIELELDADEIELNIQQAIPCGLVINELVTNAYKHAFKTSNEGTIMVGLKRKDDQISVHVANDGIVLDDEFNPFNHSSTGMILIQTLTQQIDGDLRFNNKPQTKFSFEFELE